MIKPNVGENYHKRSELEVRVCDMPVSWAQREKKHIFFSVFVLISPAAGLLRARRWIRQTAAITSLPEWDFHREERERKSERNTHKHSVSESEGGRGGMERDTTGSLLSLKGKACKTWNSCPYSVTMDPCCWRSDSYSLFWFLCENRMWRWTVYSCCADSLGVTETAGKGAEQQ